MRGGDCLTCKSSVRRSDYGDRRSAQVAFEGEAIAQHIETEWATKPGFENMGQLASMVRMYSGADDDRTLGDHFVQTLQGRLAFIISAMAAVGHYWIASYANGPLDLNPMLVLVIGVLSTLITSRIANCLALAGCNVLSWLSLLSPILDLAIVYVTLMPRPQEGHPNFPPEARDYNAL